jgi:RimJ/RimL family protein N-acetyltransferase
LVRYDRSQSGLELSFSIDRAVRGQGLGSEILVMSATRACRELNEEKVWGLTKVDNQTSIRAFERAGFIKDGESVVNGERAIRYVWTTR